MERKIIKLGTATMVASLPSKWIKANNLSPGDVLTVHEEGPQLLLSARKEARRKVAKVHISSPKEFMGRLIHTPYRFGYDRLEITFDDPSVMPLIRQFLDETLGFEIVDQSESACTIEMVAKGLDEEFDKLLRRSFLIIQGMLDDIVRALEEKAGEHKQHLLHDVIERERMIDKLTYFCMRVLNMRVSPPGQGHYHMVLVWALEQIGDAVGQIAALLLDPTKDHKDIRHIRDSKDLRKDLRVAQDTIQLTAQAFKEFTSVYAKPTPEGLLRARNTTRQARKQVLCDSQLWAPVWSLLSTIDHLLILLP